MGIKIAAPNKPSMSTAAERPAVCPACGHDVKMGKPEPELWRILFRRPKPYSCAHSHVEQDALVDNLVRCGCAHGWHY